MAKPIINGATPFRCKFHVEGVQTIVPTKPTDPRKSSTILSPQNLSSTGILQRRFHVLLCYNKASDDDSGWLVAGRMKESLGIALQEQPLLAGRLRRCEETGAELQVVSNDSGVRLVEAKAEVSIDDFVEMKEKRSEAEAELVFWEDVGELNPQFSPLFYVQVTNFTCGGYSIGISCSLLLEDPFVLTNFIKKWAKIHNDMVSTKIPTFYLPKHGKPASSPALLLGSNSCKDTAETIIFKIPTKFLNLDNNIHRHLAALCVDEAERVVGRAPASNLSLMFKVPHEDAKVETCSRKEILESAKGVGVNGLSCARTWDELGLESVCFNGGKKAVCVSCWINSVVDDEGFVMIVPSNDDAKDSGVLIVVTFN